MLMIQKSSANWIDLPKTSDNKLGISLRSGLNPGSRLNFCG